ncbi:hypothetical protein KY346_04145 [Candidatus Woesearchaeota archaeon]|nr:hypothetical protein [Candidatus Woesearchaeota archaeon]
MTKKEKKLFGMNAFKHVERIKEMLQTHFPNIPETEYSRLFSRLCGHYRHKYKPNDKICRSNPKLNNNERAIFDWLLREKYKPSTVYYWFLETRLPADVMHHLQEGNMTASTAKKIAKNRQRSNDANASMLILEQCIQAVRGWSE